MIILITVLKHFKLKPVTKIPDAVNMGGMGQGKNAGGSLLLSISSIKVEINFRY